MLKDFLGKISAEKIIETTTSILIGLLFAFFVWLLKISYEKRRDVIMLTAEVEMVCVHNHKILAEYLYLIDLWTEALSQKKPYVTSFSSFKGVDKPIVILGRDFVNNFLPTSLILDSLEDDVKFLYKQYSEAVAIFLGKVDKNKEWDDFCINSLKTLTPFKAKIKEIEDDLIKIIGHIQLVNEQKRKSIFLLLDMLHKNILPRITENVLNKRKNEIRKELEDKRN